MQKILSAITFVLVLISVSAPVQAQEKKDKDVKAAVAAQLAEDTVLGDGQKYSQARWGGASVTLPKTGWELVSATESPDRTRVIKIKVKEASSVGILAKNEKAKIRFDSDDGDGDIAETEVDDKAFPIDVKGTLTVTFKVKK